MSNINYITKKCPFCGEGMYREDYDDENALLSYECYSCGFVAKFNPDRMSSEERVEFE